MKLITPWIGVGIPVTNGIQTVVLQYTCKPGNKCTHLSIVSTFLKYVFHSNQEKDVILRSNLNMKDCIRLESSCDLI